MQPLAGSEIEFFDRPGDGRGHGGTQGFFHHPQRLLLVPGFDQDQARGVEAEAIEAMPMRPATTGEFPRRKNEQKRSGWHAAEKGGEKTEGRGRVFIDFRRDLVQRSANKPASRQMCIKCGKAKGKGTGGERNAFQSRQQPAQFIQDLGVASIAVGMAEG